MISAKVAPQTRDISEPNAGIHSQVEDMFGDSPEPLSIPDGCPGVQPFDVNLLPYAFQDWVADIANRMQCPIDFPAVAAMVSFSAVVGRRIGIRPKRKDDWLVIPNLWGVLIGRPSIMKSPPMKEASRPLDRLIADADAEYEKAKQQADMDVTVRKLRKASLESLIKNAMKRPDANTDTKALLDELHELEAHVAPVHRRYATSDTNAEALTELMASNPNGILARRDELIGLLKYLDREGQEHARAFFLEAWDGNGNYRSDRIGRGITSVQGACLSMLGTIQPDVLQAYVRDAYGGSRADGFLQRFQMAVWPDDPGQWVNVDEYPDNKARGLAYEVFARIDQGDGLSLGGEVDGFDDSHIPFLRFAPDAQDAFDKWRDNLENRRLRNGGEHPAFEAHLGKYRSLIPSLALLIHMAGPYDTAVSIDAFQRALGWETYLESHARRMYASVSNGGEIHARILAKHISAGDLGESLTIRTIDRKKWSGLTDKAAIVKAVKMLLDMDWLKVEESASGTPGRPTKTYYVNPRVYKKMEPIRY